jgi:hypothetical protein
MAGHQQEHKDEGVFELVLAIVLAYGLQLVHKVEEEKQGQKADSDKRHGDQHFTVNQAAYGFHAAAPWGLLLARN